MREYCPGCKRVVQAKRSMGYTYDAEVHELENPRENYCPHCGYVFLERREINDNKLIHPARENITAVRGLWR